MTKEYADIHEEFVRQEFPAVISTLKITAFALGVISLLITVLVHRKTGIVLSCLCIVPLIGIYYIQQRQNVFLSKLELVSNQTRAIFSDINIYLENERFFKEEVLISLFNEGTYYEEQDALRELQKIVARFDRDLLILNDADKNRRYNKQGKIISSVRSALAMKTPYTVPGDVWKKFQLTCIQYLHGRNSIATDKPCPYICLSRTNTLHWSAVPFN